MTQPTAIMPPKKEEGKKAPKPVEPKKNIAGLCERLATNKPQDEAFAKMSKLDAALHLWSLVLNAKKKAINGKIVEIVKSGGIASILTLLDKGSMDDKHVAMGALQVRRQRMGCRSCARVLGASSYSNVLNLQNKNVFISFVLNPPHLSSIANLPSCDCRSGCSALAVH